MSAEIKTIPVADEDLAYLVREYFDKASAPWLGARAVHMADPSDEIKSLDYYDAKLEGVPRVDHALDVYIDSGLYDGTL